MHLSFFCNPPTPSSSITPRTSRGRASWEKPRECRRHPRPRSLPVPGAGRCHRLPAAGAARARRVASTLSKGSEGLGRVWGRALSSAAMPSRVREEERRDVPSANFYRFSPLRTPHCPAALGCAQRARVQGEAPADLPFGLLLASREFLQSHIATTGPPQRESGVGAAAAPEGAGAPALHSLTGSCCSRRHRAFLFPLRSLAVTAQDPLLARPRAVSPAGGCLLATEGQRPRLLELSCQTEPTTSRLIYICAAIGLCK